jgi:hypothetical protein
MLYFSEQNKRGCYTSESIHTGDAIFLRTNKWGMLCFSEQNKEEMQYFSEQTNGGCYASQNIQTGDAMLLRTKQMGMLYF